MKVYKNLLLLVMVSISAHASAQTPVSFVERAMEANGPWKDLHTFHYTSKYKGYNPWQAYSYPNPKATKNTAEFYMDFDNKRYRNHSIFNYPGGYVFSFVTVGKDSLRYLYDKNFMRNGKVLLKQGKESYLSNREFALQSLPYYQMKILLETKDSLEYKTRGAEATIRRFLKNGSTLDYLIDQQNFQLKKIIRTTGLQVQETNFDNYKHIEGLTIPGTTTQTSNGKITRTEVIKSFKVNPVIPPAVFDIPATYVLQNDVPAKPLEAKEIARDVFLVEGVGGDRNVIFVNMSDYIIITEAPLSSGVTKSVLDVIHKTLPGKPVKYVHLSHHHNDHTSGLRQLVTEGAIIICTPPLEAPMRALVKGETGITGDDYSKKPSEPVFELFTGVKVLEDKDHRVEFHQVANSHADGLSFLYLPKELIIYEGDLLTVPEDGTLTPAIAASKEFNRYLRKNDIKYNRIIGHHSFGFITPQIFKAMLQLKGN